LQSFKRDDAKGLASIQSVSPAVSPQPPVTKLANGREAPMGGRPSQPNRTTQSIAPPPRPSSFRLSRRAAE